MSESDLQERATSALDRHLSRIRQGAIAMTMVGLLSLAPEAASGQESPASNQPEVADYGATQHARISETLADSLRRNRAARDSLIEKNMGIEVDRSRRNEVQVPGTDIKLSELDPGQLEFAGDLLEQLTEKMRGRRTETTFCLTGKIEDDRAVVTGFYQPQVLSETEKQVRHISCQEMAPDHVGVLHNHPPHMLEDSDLRSTFKKVRGRALEEPEDLCYLSPADQTAALYDFGVRRQDDQEFQVVMVGAQARCWWSWDQIDSREMDTVVSFIEDQIERSDTDRTELARGR